MKLHAHKLAALTTACVLAFGVVQPAHALFGVGDIVLDPTNLVQNTLTAVRTLEQINNQIRQLQNEAQMLINQARNLASLPSSVVGQLRANLATTQRLIDEVLASNPPEGFAPAWLRRRGLDWAADLFQQHPHHQPGHARPSGETP